MTLLPKRALIFCLLFCISSCGYLAAAQARVKSEKIDTQAIGYHLVNSYWKNVMQQDVASYSSKIACNFQGLNTHGIYTRENQITGLSNLTVTAFTLSNLTTSRFGKTLVISYNFYATGEGIVSGPSIDIWHKCGKKWKLISHSYVPFTSDS